MHDSLLVHVLKCTCNLVNVFNDAFLLKVDFISFYLNNKEPDKKKNRDRRIAREARNVISGTNIEPSFAVQTIDTRKPTYNLVVLLGVGLYVVSFCLMF